MAGRMIAQQEAAQRDADLVEQAVAIIDGEALDLRISHTSAPDHNDWTDEEDVHAQYIEWKKTVEALYRLADSMRAT
jgi:hypothetical protein